MRKILNKAFASTIASILAVSAMPLSNVCADDEVDLKQLASSLGADTDMFNFPNYRGTDCSKELIERIWEQWEGDADLHVKQCYAGLCNSFSVLEVLNHNGVISPNDLQEGAETLYDVEFTPYINDVMCYYSVMQGFKLQDRAYHEYFCSHDSIEQCQDLINYGKNAMETGKYFFIAFTNSNFAHAIAGIGIADGHWSFNNKEYDKCILTLDSNSKDSSGKACFNENFCIYINSAKNEMYFPAYECDSANGDTYITYITDDTELLNNKGYINPSETYPKEYDSLMALGIMHGKCGEYDITIDADGKSEKFHGYPKAYIEGITKNAWSIIAPEIDGRYFLNVDKISLESMQNDDENITFDLRGLNGNMNCLTFYGKGRATYSYSDLNDEYTFTNLGSENGKFSFEIGNGIKGNPNNKYTFPWNSLLIDGNIHESITMKCDNNGVLFSSTDNNVQLSAIFGQHIYDENHKYSPKVEQFNIFSSNDLMIRCKENSDELYFAIGNNYDIPVETGDVNCDGKINASDASYILADYALGSTGASTLLNQGLADFNKDGKINSIDASDVLAEYSRLSTE